MQKSIWTLIVGDVIALAVIIVIGFASHGETAISFVPRMLTTFIPLVVSWFLIAPWLGLFNAQITSNPKKLWRSPLAMLLAAPMTAILRAAMLNTVALPLFMLILGGSAALGMLVWRSLYLWRFHKLGQK
jgi:flagellar biosynthesis protein FliQ